MKILDRQVSQPRSGCMFIAIRSATDTHSLRSEMCLAARRHIELLTEFLDLTRRML